MKFSILKPILIGLIFSLMLTRIGFAQEGNGIRERIFLQSDRDIYVAGEDLLFTIHLFNSSGNPSTTSKFGYIALRSPEQVIIRQSIELDQSFSHGHLYLPDTLSTGYYELVAFTNWMRNEGEDCYFSRQLFIANRFDKELTAIASETNTHPGMQEAISEERNVNGLSLKVAQNEKAFEITVNQEGEQPINASLQMIRSHRILWEQNIHVLNGQKTFNIPASELEDGLVLFRLKDHDGVNLQRWWYFEDQASAPTLHIKNEFQRRERARLSIQPNGSPVKRISVAVVKSFGAKAAGFDLKSYQRVLRMAIELQMEPNLLSQEFGGLDLEDLNQKLETLNIRPEDIETASLPEQTFFMETSRQLISGMVTHAQSGQPAANVKLLLNVPDTLTNLMYTTSEPDGSFQFILTPYYNNKYLFITALASPSGEKTRIVLHDKFHFEKSFSPRAFPGLSEQRDFIAERQERIRIKKTYGIDYFTPDSIHFQAPFPAPRLFSQASQTIRPENYEQLDNLFEIARELVGPWRIRRSGGTHVHTLVCATTGAFLPGRPMLFVDGVMVLDLDQFIHLGSNQIEEIQVHNLNWVYGDMHIPGIIAIFTKTNEHENIHYQNGFVKEFNEAPTNPVAYKLVVYNGRENFENNRPDLREVLLWEPEVSLGSEKTELAFYTGDLSGEFLVLVQGFTADNKPFSIYQNIRVNR
ncbi:MAG: hypothetical protein K0B09_07575 [Bacteroidales bacterium]|nr:hypothetical protein [Bacteroidales bacterium]